MPKNPTTEDRKRGLYPKYQVERINDPVAKHAGCRYFVLDPQHDPIARDALALYAARAERDGYRELARDLHKWLQSVPEAKES
jgi:hypothetical protein